MHAELGQGFWSERRGQLTRLIGSPDRMRACDRPILDSKGVRGRSSWISSHCSRLRGLRLACTSANSLACLSIRSGSSDSSYCIHQTPLLNIQNSKPLLSIKVDSSHHCTKFPIWCGSYLNGYTTRSREKNNLLLPIVSLNYVNHGEEAPLQVHLNQQVCG